MHALGLFSFESRMNHSVIGNDWIYTAKVVLATTKGSLSWQQRLLRPFLSLALLLSDNQPNARWWFVLCNAATCSRLISCPNFVHQILGKRLVPICTVTSSLLLPPCQVHCLFLFTSLSVQRQWHDNHVPYWNRRSITLACSQDTRRMICMGQGDISWRDDRFRASQARYLMCHTTA